MAGGVKAGRLEIEILADVARLQQDMERIKRAVKDASGDIARNAKVANDNIAAIGTGSRFTANQTRNLAFQFQDLGVQFAMAANSSKPLQGALMALAMQGPQIAMVLKEANQSLAGLAKEMGGAAAGFARAHPVMTALAVATAATGASFALFTREINAERKAELDAYSKSLGLSAEELKKLGPLTITAADAFNGLWKTIKESLGLEKYFKMLGAAASQVFSGMLTAAKYAAAGIYAGFVGTVEGIKNSWAALPGILAEAATAAANAAISAIEKLINWQITGINKLISGINAVLGPFMEKTIGSLSPVQLGRITSGYEGAGKKAGQGFVAGYTNAFGQAVGAMDRFGARWADNTVDAAKKRYHDLAESKGFLDDEDSKKAGGKAGKKAGEAFTDAMLAQIRKGFEEALGQSMENVSALLKANENVDYAEAMRQMGDNLDRAQKPLKDIGDAQAEWNDQLALTVGYLESIGGTAGKFGALFGALTTGDWSNLGSQFGGKAGSLLGMMGSISWQGTDETGQRITKTLATELRDIFSKKGPFGETLRDVLQGAGTGLAIGGVAFGNSKSGQIGAGIGGALGQALGEKFLSKGLESIAKGLGSAAGPLGAIAGSLLGGLLGGLLKKAKTGSATIGVSNGELGIGGVRGNSSSRRTASTQGANSVIDALNTIAEAFGASLGTANVSIGMRDNSYRVDTTGQGRTKGAGVINFGKDSEAALKAAIADAISDGVFVGLSAGVERLLKNGDVEKQLQKALSFQAVFDDLAAAKDPAQAAQDAITKWHDSMAKIFAEAGATAEELAKLEELTGIKRAEAAKQSAEQIVEDLRPYREAEIQIMQLEGKTAEALAAQRALETEGMTDGLKALYTRIYALQDEAEATAKAAEIAATRKELETQLLEVTDPVAAALVRHNDALEALDPSLRDLYQQLVDARAAADAAAEAEKLLAEQRDKAANDATTRVDQLRALTIRYAKALGQDAAALELERADALRDLDPSLREFMKVIWGIEDATEATAKAAADLKTAAEEAQKLADQRRSLQIQLADILNPAEAEAMRRADTLAALTDPISRSYQEQIYAALDLKAAQEAAAKVEQDRVAGLDALHSQLMDAYQRESGVLQSTIDKMRGFTESIMAFRDGLLSKANPLASTAVAGKRFASTAAMAGFGDEAALGRFTSDAQAYLDAARGGTEAQYRKALSEVLRGSNSAISGTANFANTAQKQLDAMNLMVGKQEAAGQAFETFASLYDRWQSSIATETIPAVSETVTLGLENVAQAVTAGNQSTEQRLANLEAAMIGMAGNVASMNGYLRTAHRGDSFAVTADDPLQTEVVA